MDNKKTRRYLVWLLIGAFIIVGGVLGNALLGNGEPMPDQTLKYTQTSNGNIEKTDGCIVARDHVLLEKTLKILKTI